MANDKERCQKSRQPCSGKHPGSQVDYSKEKSLEAEHTLDIEENRLHASTDKYAKKRTVDGSQKELLVDVESVKNVDCSETDRRIRVTQLKSLNNLALVLSLTQLHS